MVSLATEVFSSMATSWSLSPATETLADASHFNRDPFSVVRAASSYVDSQVASPSAWITQWRLAKVVDRIPDPAFPSIPLNRMVPFGPACEGWAPLVVGDLPLAEAFRAAIRSLIDGIDTDSKKTQHR